MHGKDCHTRDLERREKHPIHTIPRELENGTKLKPAAHESYRLSKKLLVPVSSADSSHCACGYY